MGKLFGEGPSWTRESRCLLPVRCQLYHRVQAFRDVEIEGGGQGHGVAPVICRTAGIQMVIQLGHGDEDACSLKFTNDL